MKKSPCEKCDSKTCGGIRFRQCWKWTDWFRNAWRSVCEETPAVLEKKKRREEQKNYRDRLYREDMRRWK